MHESKGFTLLEMVIVIGVFGVISVLFSTILINVLRGAQKTNILTSLRQNGDTLMTQMSRDLRSATVLSDSTPCSTMSTSVLYTAIDGSQKGYTCLGNNISDGTNNLLDPITTSLTSCSITCTQSVGENPIITIDYVLQNARGGSQADRSGQIEFKTSVVMRNVGGR